MTPTIFRVNENATVQQVADTMIRGRIHRVFVTQEEKVVGIISAADMLRVIRDM
jgi:CBS domain-containing protein